MTFPSLLAVTDILPAGGFGLLVTSVLLGIRHGFDWDHIAAITDITSTTSAADLGTATHESLHGTAEHDHVHGHGGLSEIRAHDAGPGAATLAVSGRLVAPSVGLGRRRLLGSEVHAIRLGTLYALGHASVVAALGLAALAFGAVLPDWVDPIMARIVGATLMLLGIWVFVSLYQYIRFGTEFRLRSRWMIVFHVARMGWRRLQAKLHGHEHVAPIEMSSYGTRTAFGVGIIHGIGAETGTQVLLIAAIGGAAGAGLGVPMMIAFIAGLLVSNTAIVLITATGFVATQLRQRLYVGIGVVAGAFSLGVGLVFLLGSSNLLPDLGHALGFLGS